jgi:glucose/arabinose dehydrogenase
MKTPLLAIPLCALLLLTQPLRAQDGNRHVITDEMLGHIFRPAQVRAVGKLSQLKLPEGFTISQFADGLGSPRMLEVTPEGFIYVTNRNAGTVTLLRDTNNDGIAEIKKEVAKREQMHGIDYYNGKLYLITIKQVFVADIHADGTLGELKAIINNLPDAGQHNNRTLHFGPDGKLYISIGSTCNSCEDPNKENATILQANADGSNRHIYASGLRNTIGFDWHPVTKQLWGFDHGIDWLGDNEQSEELNRIEEGEKYGWPYVYENGKPDKHHSPPFQSYELYALRTKKPVLLYTAHAAPMDMIFYTGSQFPAEYKNDAFVTMHGSWNRDKPSGYRIVRVHFNEAGQPEKITDFITGFYNPQDSTMFARVCGLVQLKDGSLLVADDANGIIYRIAYSSQPMIVKREE